MDLQKERASLVAQRDNAFAVYHQAIGAISLLDALIAEQPEDALTVEDVGKLLGAKEIGQPAVNE